jgi:hypothetical protein
MVAIAPQRPAAPHGAGFAVPVGLRRPSTISVRRAWQPGDRASENLAAPGEAPVAAGPQHLAAGDGVVACTMLVESSIDQLSRSVRCEN